MDEVVEVQGERGKGMDKVRQGHVEYAGNIWQTWKEHVDVGTGVTRKGMNGRAGGLKNSTRNPYF